MKNKVMKIIKYNRMIYNIYYYVMSFSLKILKVFIKIDDNLILFNSFGGKKYDDSTKEIFEYMKSDFRFKDFKFVWALNDPNKFSISGAYKVKVDTLQYFIIALKAKVWITNSGFERGLSFKNKNTLYINTWHGSPIKKMGIDICRDNKSFSSKAGIKADVMNAQSDYDIDVFSRAFEISKDKFIPVGLPRNDRLVNYTTEEVNSIKNKLQIQPQKRIILYAPTFREYSIDQFSRITEEKLHLDKWRKALGNDYVILMRAHYEAFNKLDLHDDSFVKNVTDYPCLDDLIIVSDILISDYSSIYFDYSITGKSMLYFTYDYDVYKRERGMYFDIRKYLFGADNEDDLINLIETKSKSDLAKKTEYFRKEFVNYFGNATEKTVDIIYEKLNTRSDKIEQSK